MSKLSHTGDSNPFRNLTDIMADRTRHGEAFVEAENMARVLIKEAKDGKNAFFTSNDRAYFVFTVLALAVFSPELCYPAYIYRTLSDPNELRGLLGEARNSDILGGDLRALASSLIAKELDNPEHAESGRTGASNALSIFKSSSLLGSVGMRDEFDFTTVRDPKLPPTIIFDVIPSDKIEVFKPLVALSQSTRLNALKKHREGRDVIFLCDEASNLAVPSAVRDIELMRSFGITLALFYQSYSSLERVYGKDQAASIRASSAEIYFNIGDIETAEMISKRAGDITVKTNSQSFGENGKPSRSVGETSRRLLPPEEILAMPKDQALLLLSGMRPIKLTKTPWFKVDPFKDWAGENPHENHAPSNETMLTLEYGKDASELGAPIVPNLINKIKAALKLERKNNRAVSVAPVRLRSLMFIPIIAAAWVSLHLNGTPHVIFEYTQNASRTGTAKCVYVGLSGIRRTSLPGHCPKIKFLRHDQSRPWRGRS